MKNVFFFFAVILLLTACNQNESSSSAQEGVASFNRDSLMLHIKVLASDSFEGRKPFSAGETKTVDYMEHAFKQLGLEPGNSDSYLQ